MIKARVSHSWGAIMPPRVVMSLEGITEWCHNDQLYADGSEWRGIQGYKVGVTEMRRC